MSVGSNEKLKADEPPISPTNTDSTAVPSSYDPESCRQKDKKSMFLMKLSFTITHWECISMRYDQRTERSCVSAVTAALEIVCCADFGLPGLIATELPAPALAA